jgi:hypothetical protein
MPIKVQFLSKMAKRSRLSLEADLRLRKETAASLQLESALRVL